MEANFGLSYITKVFYSVITVILLIVIYTYINSLENKGCQCALPPNINFIKGFTIFAIIYLIFTGLVSEKVIYDNFGVNILIINKFVDLIFALVFVYYLYEVVIYTRRLVNEKCKCSEDIRREIISIGSIIIFMLLFFFVVLQILIAIIFGAINGAINSISKTERDSHNILRNPIDSLTKLPSKLKEDLNDITSSIKNTSKKIKNTINSNKKR